MSVCLDTYPFDCPNCNYTASAKNEKTWKMIRRLHNKKCKHTGRTEEKHAEKHARAVQKIFKQNNIGCKFDAAEETTTLHYEDKN